MESFEDFEIADGLVEMLAAEGVETPTPVQVQALPVLLKGNNVVLAAGPGAGAFAAYASAILTRTEPSTGGPSVLVVAPLPDIAEALAESMARLAQGTGHAVAALGRPWALPERADIIFGTPAEITTAVSAGHLSLADVCVVVIEGANILAARGLTGDLESLFEMVAPSAQRILVSLPVTEAVEKIAREHLPKGVRIPTQSGETEGPDRGTLTYKVVGEDKEGALASAVADFLDDGMRHVLVYCRSEDRAADLGDHLALHGYMAGKVGDDSTPVWLAVDALEARKDFEGFARPETIATLSVDIPPDEDTLDRRHSIGRKVLIFTLPRELHHLRSIALGAGYQLKAAPVDTGPVQDQLSKIRRRLSNAAKTDLSAHGAVLTPLLDSYSAYELAAAALALLHEAEAAAAKATPTRPVAGKAQTVDGMKRLFVSLGSKDGLEAKDVLGAMAGESDIDGRHFGRIEVKETFSIVEVEESFAAQVIKAVNGRTIRSRAVRVDYDRPTKSDRGGSGRGGDRGGSGRHDRTGPPRGSSRGGPPRGGRGGPPRGDRGGPSRGGRGGPPRG
jgi:ATP-dependent RNA helicase DeaD